MTAIIATKLALIEAPPPESLATVNPAQFSGVDGAKISAGALTMHFFDMTTFADAWAARTTRYACGPIGGLRRSAMPRAPWLTTGLAGCPTTGGAADHP
jgi:hypothetical protein